MQLEQKKYEQIKKEKYRYTDRVETESDTGRRRTGIKSDDSYAIIAGIRSRNRGLQRKALESNRLTDKDNEHYDSYIYKKIPAE